MAACVRVAAPAHMAKLSICYALLLRLQSNIILP